MSKYNKVACFVGVHLKEETLLVQELLHSCEHNKRNQVGANYCPVCGVKVEEPKYKVTGKIVVPDLEEVPLYNESGYAKSLLLGMYAKEFDVAGSHNCAKLQNLDSIKANVLEILKENGINTSTFDVYLVNSYT